MGGESSQTYQEYMAELASKEAEAEAEAASAEPIEADEVSTAVAPEAEQSEARPIPTSIDGASHNLKLLTDEKKAEKAADPESPNQAEITPENVEATLETMLEAIAAVQKHHAEIIDRQTGAADEKKRSLHMDHLKKSDLTTKIRKAYQEISALLASANDSYSFVDRAEHASQLQYVEQYLAQIDAGKFSSEALGEEPTNDDAGAPEKGKNTEQERADRENVDALIAELNSRRGDLSDLTSLRDILQYTDRFSAIFKSLYEISKASSDAQLHSDISAVINQADALRQELNEHTSKIYLLNLPSSKAGAEGEAPRREINENVTENTKLLEIRTEVGRLKYQLATAPDTNVAAQYYGELVRNKVLLEGIRNSTNSLSTKNDIDAFLAENLATIEEDFQAAIDRIVLQDALAANEGLEMPTAPLPAEPKRRPEPSDNLPAWLTADSEGPEDRVEEGDNDLDWLSDLESESYLFPEAPKNDAEGKSNDWVQALGDAQTSVHLVDETAGPANDQSEIKKETAKVGEDDYLEVLTPEQKSAITELQTYAATLVTQFEGLKTDQEVSDKRKEISEKDEFKTMLSRLNKVQDYIIESQLFSSFADDYESTYKNFDKVLELQLKPIQLVINGIQDGTYPPASLGEVAKSDLQPPLVKKDEKPDAIDSPPKAGRKESRELHSSDVPAWLINAIRNSTASSGPEDGPSTISFVSGDYLKQMKIPSSEVRATFDNLLANMEGRKLGSGSPFHREIAPMFLALATKYIDEMDLTQSTDKRDEFKQKLREISQKVVDINIRLPISHNELRNVLSNLQIELNPPTTTASERRPAPTRESDAVLEEEEASGKDSEKSFGRRMLDKLSEKSKLLIPFLVRTTKQLIGNRRARANGEVAKGQEAAVDTNTFEDFDKYIFHVQSQVDTLKPEELNAKSLVEYQKMVDYIKNWVAWAAREKKFDDETQEELNDRYLKVRDDFKRKEDKYKKLHSIS